MEDIIKTFLFTIGGAFSGYLAYLGVKVQSGAARKASTDPDSPISERQSSEAYEAWRDMQAPMLENLRSLSSEVLTLRERITEIERTAHEAATIAAQQIKTLTADSERSREIAKVVIVYSLTQREALVAAGVDIPPLKPTDLDALLATFDAPTT